MNSEQMEKELIEIFDSPREEKIQRVNEVISAYKNLTHAATVAVEEAKKQADLSTTFAKQIQELTKSNLSLMESIKNIHIALNAEYDVVMQNENLLGLTQELGRIISSPEAIKLGVIKKAVDNV